MKRFKALEKTDKNLNKITSVILSFVDDYMENDQRRYHLLERKEEIEALEESFTAIDKFDELLKQKNVKFQKLLDAGNEAIKKIHDFYGELHGKSNFLPVDRKMIKYQNILFPTRERKDFECFEAPFGDGKEKQVKYVIKDGRKRLVVSFPLPLEEDLNPYISYRKNVLYAIGKFAYDTDTANPKIFKKELMDTLDQNSEIYRNLDLILDTFVKGYYAITDASGEKTWEIGHFLEYIERDEEENMKFGEGKHQVYLLKLNREIFKAIQNYIDRDVKDKDVEIEPYVKYPIPWIKDTESQKTKARDYALSVNTPMRIKTFLRNSGISKDKINNSSKKELAKDLEDKLNFIEASGLTWRLKKELINEVVKKEGFICFLNWIDSEELEDKIKKLQGKIKDGEEDQKNLKEFSDLVKRREFQNKLTRKNITPPEKQEFLNLKIKFNSTV